MTKTIGNVVGKVGKGLGLTQDPPQLPPLPDNEQAPPTVDEARARVESRDEQRRRRGRRASIFAGARGGSEGSQVSKTTLMGS